MILSGDIKLLASDTMTDAAEGGGAMTGNVIVDGQSNNIFDDISTMDRVYGAVHMRKVFPAVQTQTTDKYFGSHVIISKLPGDGKIGVNLFNTGDYFDRRPSAQSRVENYRAQGPKYNGYLWGTQYKESRAIAIFQGETAPVPGIGDVLKIVSATASQYVRIVRLSDSVQTFTDGSGTFKRRILEIELSDVLAADFVGVEMSRVDTLTPDAKLYKTVVANAARYYSAQPLAVAGQIGDRTVKVASVYSQVVPSSQAEYAMVDVTAGGHAQAVIDSAGGTVSFATSTSFAANGALYLGSPCLPGTLSIPVSGGTITDNAGTLKIGSTSIGTINYADGTLAFSAASPTYAGAKTVTFRPAAAPVRLANTTSIPVTAANRGYVWTINITPAPKPMSINVAYRALNSWYELADNGAGGLVGTEAGIGSGTVNYVTGSLSVTLSALPDVGSEIILSWGANIDITNRSNISAPPVKITKTLSHSGVLPASLVITWNDGTARTLTCNALGVLAGYGSGKFNAATDTVEFSPTTLPLGGTSFTVNYDYGTLDGEQIVETFTNVADASGYFVLPLANEPYPGTVVVDTETFYNCGIPRSNQYYKSGNDLFLGYGPWVKENLYLQDDLLGGLAPGTGSINYVGKSVSLPTQIDMGHHTRTAILGDPITTTAPNPSGAGTYTYTTTPLVGYDDSTSAVNTLHGTSITVKYRKSSDVTHAQDTLTLAALEVDLTPGYAEAIVQGAARFAVGGRTYIDRMGQLYYNLDPTTGSGTFGGTLDYESGMANITAWATGVSNAVSLQSLATTMNFNPVTQAVFRTPVAPVKVGVFSIRAVPADGGGQISATSNNQGSIQTDDMLGRIEYETGVVNIMFGQRITAAGHEGESWYSAAAVGEDGKIFKPRPVFPDTIIYNSVAYTYLPLSSTILGLDPVRLPADGRVPVYSAGDVVVVLNDQTTIGTYTSGATTDLGRGRLAKLTVRDAAGQMLAVDKYSADLDTGIITWGSLSGVSQPLTIVDRIEDMAVLSDVQITGTLALSQPLTHAFPLEGTLVSNAIVYGTLYARTSIPFDQQTWTNVWSDTLIGSSVAAQYNNTQYPIVVDNASCIQERWVVVFTSTTAFNVTGEHVGQIVTGSSTLTDTAPINPNTGLPYFTIPAQGWGSGWSAGNVLRFNTYGANAPTWIIQAIGQGEATSNDYTFCLEVRGDIDTL